jgi:hypothetical protein
LLYLMYQKEVKYTKWPLNDQMATKLQFWGANTLGISTPIFLSFHGLILPLGFRFLWSLAYPTQESR